MRRLALVLLATLAAAPAARADTFKPPPGKVYTGVSGGVSTQPYSGEVGKDIAVMGVFVQWDGGYDYAFRAADAAGARLMLHISTQDGYGTPERVTPRGIARGQGDGYLLRLNRRIAEEENRSTSAAGRDEPDQQRLLRLRPQRPLARRPPLAPRRSSAAWRRATLILRGGPRAAIDAEAARAAPAADPGRRRRPAAAADRDDVGAADRGLAGDQPPTRPRAYWPGGRYVDWVGTDFYSRFPAFEKLERFYKEFKGKPFVFGEWALWGADDPGFVHRFFNWIRSHGRVRMQLYNQGGAPGGPFRLKQYPRSRKVIRAELRKPRHRGRP